MHVPAGRSIACAIAAGLLVGMTAGAEAHAAEPCAVTGYLPAPPVPRPQYALRIQVLPDLRTVTGTLTVTFPVQGVDRLVFRLWPNGPLYARAGARLTVSHVREGAGAASVSMPNPTTLIVSQSPAAGRPVISMDWRLALPRETGLRLKGGNGSVRLGSFFPLLAWDGQDWARDPPTTLPSGEAWTSPIADFDVRVTHPRGLRALASGQQLAPGRWRARAVRDFTLALGRFAIATGVAQLPSPVRVTIGVERSPGATRPGVLVRSAIASLERYSTLYGAYPWPTFTVAAMADLSDPAGGLEYPTLVYQPATSENVAHETGHQWFYSLVGNDQARDPWLDEGLTTWAEAAVNGAPPFSNVPIPPEVEDRIGRPMTFWDRFGVERYFLGVYLQTYRALLTLAPRAQVDCALHQYVLDNAYRIARPRDLLNALQRYFPDAEQTLTRYGAHF